jgi:hypothetical protein
MNGDIHPIDAIMVGLLAANYGQNTKRRHHSFHRFDHAKRKRNKARRQAIKRARKT